MAETITIASANNFSPQFPEYHMKLKKAGLPSLAVLILIFFIYLFFHAANTTGFAFFMYGITMIHILYTIIQKWVSGGPFTSSMHICNLAMLTISCFTLNSSIEIFATFTPWVYIVLLLTFVTLLLEAFVEIPSMFWRFAYGFIVTCGLFVSIYFNMLLLPMFHIGLLGMLLLGLGIHLFVPALLMFTIMAGFYKRRQSKMMITGIISACLLVAGSLWYFLFSVGNANRILEKVNVDLVTGGQKDLPRWVYVAQQIPKNRWTELILTGDFKYELFDEWFMDRPINTGNSMGDKGLHEPFLNIAKLLGKQKSDLSDAERLMILKSNFNNRHETSRKLWSGEHLTTSQCVTDIQLYPGYRMAYTQKTFFIKNVSPYEWQSEEALYTLHLPDNAVVNSMSLWVNGVERKSRLTTKEKADSAYVQIVGVQSRDPALLHWQEGNRVSVTVFPCTSKEVRMLKIGYTTPLQVNNNKLVYKDIFVEGPVFDRCRNDVHIASSLNLHDVKSSSVNLELGADMLTAQFTGDRDWDLQLPYTPLAAQSFSFNHQSFRLAEEKNDPTAFTAENIVLDINTGWTKKEFTALISACKNKKVWYASDENTLCAIDGNAEQVWNTMSRKNFQLIPFHKVDPGNTVLIVKPALNAPSYRDLDSSAYAIKLAQNVQRSVRPLHCFKINTPDRDLLYSTLNDMQYLAVHPLSLDACLSALQKGTIDRPYADEQSVNIDDANMNIVRSYSDSNSGAPDHLMRLFYYKKILSQSAGYYFSKTNDAALQPCVQMANDAFIVSPVSSLIVLETDSDYNAMGIDQNSGSLLNATKKGKGAVPEPHEWVLLIFGTLALLVLIGRQTKMI